MPEERGRSRRDSRDRRRRDSRSPPSRPAPSRPKKPVIITERAARSRSRGERKSAYYRPRAESKEPRIRIPPSRAPPEPKGRPPKHEAAKASSGPVPPGPVSSSAGLAGRGVVVPPPKREAARPLQPIPPSRPPPQPAKAKYQTAAPLLSPTAKTTSSAAPPEGSTVSSANFRRLTLTVGKLNTERYKQLIRLKHENQTFKESVSALQEENVGLKESVSALQKENVGLRQDLERVVLHVAAIEVSIERAGITVITEDEQPLTLQTAVASTTGSAQHREPSSDSQGSFAPGEPADVIPDDTPAVPKSDAAPLSAAPQPKVPVHDLDGAIQDVLDAFPDAEEDLPQAEEDLPQEAEDPPQVAEGAANPAEAPVTASPTDFDLGDLD